MVNDKINYEERAKHERTMVIGNAIGVLLTKIQKLLNSFTTSIKCKRAYNELNALTDNQLKDIGMNRSEIRYRVMECYAQK